MRNLKIIGLYSPVMGSGKSTLARHLAERLNLQVVSFADPLKAMAFKFLDEWGVDVDVAEAMCWGTAEEKAQIVPGLSVTGRHILQTLGTEWGRNCVRQDVWSEMAMRRAEAAVSAGFYGAVIDDLRFPDEMTKIRERGGICIKIVRPGLGQQTGLGHASEGSLDGQKFDAVITNDGSVAQLEYAGRQVVIPYVLGKPADLMAELDVIVATQGTLAGKAIKLIDPDNPKEFTLFEDMDQDLVDYRDNLRRMLVTFEPGYSNAVYRTGDGSRHQEVITHTKAITDIKKMVKNGWVIESIVRDL